MTPRPLPAALTRELHAAIAFGAIVGLLLALLDPRVPLLIAGF